MFTITYILEKVGSKLTFSNSMFSCIKLTNPLTKTHKKSSSGAKFDLGANPKHLSHANPFIQV